MYKRTMENDLSCLKMCKTLHDNCKFFPVQGIINQAPNVNKLKLVKWSLSCSLSVYFLYKILVLNSKVNSPQKLTLMNHDFMQWSYPDLYV